MIRSRLLLATVLISIAAPALAQPVPFDMTPESDLRVIPPPAAPPTTAQPLAVQPVVAQRSEHFLLPSGDIRLTGEESRQSVIVYLTKAQAEAPARLQMAYLNAVVVAPEISQLTIRVNGTQLQRNPVASSSSPAPIAMDVPAGLLREGANRIEFSASLRHRTDCTVTSTYELWTEIDSTTARLSFEGGNLGQLRQLSDLAALGVDAEGATTIRLITPDLGDPEATRVAIELAQQLALSLRVANLHVERATTLSQGFAPGVLDVVLGPATALPSQLAQYATQAASGSVAALLVLPSGANTLLV